MTSALKRLATVAVLAIGWTAPLLAQQPDSVARRQQRTLDSLAAALRAMQARIDSLTRQRPRGDTAADDELAALRAAAATAAGDTAAVPAGTVQAPRSLNALNPEFTATGDIRAMAFDPGPQAGNAFVREVELGIQSALDPFATAKVFVALEDGEAHIEEAYAYYAGLPGHLRLDAGRFRQTFGELNRWHLHALPEDEYPLVLRRYAGEEGLAGTGLSLYWPLPFSGPAGTYELTLQGTTGDNEVMFAGGGRPSLSAQLSGFWQLSRTTFAQLSVSALRGSNPDTSLTTTAGAIAARFSWRPPDRARSREITVRGELWALRRQLEQDAFDRTRLGGYADVSVRLSRRLVVSTRADYVQSPEPGPFGYEWAVTPALTFWQSEFVYLRALAEHLRTVTGEKTNRAGLQLVFAMGPHKHELF